MPELNLDELERKSMPPMFSFGYDEMISIPEGVLPADCITEAGAIDINKAFNFFIKRVRELEAENRTLGERLCETEHDLTEALDKKEELERRAAELAQENSNQKRVIQMLEYRVLDLKGKPIPMEPRLPTCDALCRPRYILQSNCSNAAKEAGE